MLVMVGASPCWLCDVCHGPIKAGVVVYSQASLKGHFPVPQTCCGEACAAVAEQTLTVEPVRRMGWPEFLDALHH
jgi:hypothetical protein